MAATTAGEENKKIRGRILFTGTGERLIEYVSALVSREHEAVQCNPNAVDFEKAVRRLTPHVVVICLQNESRDMLRAYDILNDDHALSDIPVILIGHEDDCAQFEGRVPLKHTESFLRPLNQEKFVKSLEKFVMLHEVLHPRVAPTPVKKVAEVIGEMDLKDILDATEILTEAELQSMAPSTQQEEAMLQRIAQLSLLHGRKNILVVDDDVRMLNVIKIYLQDLYDVAVVPSGRLAVKYISKKSTDLVLLDFLMPEMDGPDVLKQIRTESNQPDIPVLFLTGVAEKGGVLRGLEYHPNGYLLKPVSRFKLLEKVTELVLGL